MVLLCGIAGFLALQWLAGGTATRPSPSPPLVDAGLVEVAGDTVPLVAEGFVRAPAAIELVSEVEGRIVRIADGLKSGARFASGTLLVELDNAIYSVALAEARATLQRARSELQQAQNQADRITALANRNLRSEASLEETLVARDRAEAAVEQAEAAVRRAEIRLDDTRIHAPFDALVVEERAALGRYMRPGESVARLAATDHAEIEVGLSPDQATVLAGAPSPVGLDARIWPARSENGPGHAAVVDRVQPEIDPASRTLDLVVRVDEGFRAAGDRQPLRLGELARVSIQAPAGPDWWRIPAAALKQSDRLWRLDDQDRLEAVPVDVILRGGDHAIVRSETLAAGDRILLTDLAQPAPGLQVHTPAQGAGERQ